MPKTTERGRASEEGVDLETLQRVFGMNTEYHSAFELTEDESIGKTFVKASVCILTGGLSALTKWGRF